MKIIGIINKIMNFIANKNSETRQTRETRETKETRETSFNDQCLSIFYDHKINSIFIKNNNHKPLFSNFKSPMPIPLDFKDE
jgi:hypothetical protein